MEFETQKTQFIEPTQSILYFMEETDSTLLALPRILSQNPAGDFETFPALYTAHQTGGKGRLEGRTWLAPKGQNLLFTQYLPHNKIPFPLHLLPLFTAAVTANWISLRYHLEPKIQWPNDLLLEGKKVCGIRCEMHKGYSLAGIGINLNQTKFSDNYRKPPISTALLGKKEPSISDAAQSLMCFIIAELHNPNWFQTFNERMCKTQKSCLFVPGDPTREKPLSIYPQSIAQDGALIAQTEEGEEVRYYSGEFI